MCVCVCDSRGHSNATDYTAKYGRSFQRDIMQFILAKECILDGEVLTWNVTQKKFEAFGSNRRTGLDVDRPDSDDENANEAEESHENGPGDPARADELDMDDHEDSTSSSSSSNSAAAGTGHRDRFQFCYIVFDVLWVDGVSWVDRPLVERREQLRKIVNEQDHSLQVVKFRTVTRQDEILTHLEEALASDQEGIIIKHTDSKYEPGVRNDSWVKLKPDYMDTQDKLDLIVLGANVLVTCVICMFISCDFFWDVFILVFLCFVVIAKYILCMCHDRWLLRHWA
jgi:hypothetical protein